MGTAQMGSCAKKSVTRNDGRVHGFENLTIIDASVFVTSSPVNPTHFTVASSKGCRFDECKTCRSLTGRDAMSKETIIAMLDCLIPGDTTGWPACRPARAF